MISAVAPLRSNKYKETMGLRGLVWVNPELDQV